MSTYIEELVSLIWQLASGAVTAVALLFWHPQLLALMINANRSYTRDYYT